MALVAATGGLFRPQRWIIANCPAHDDGPNKHPNSTRPTARRSHQPARFHSILATRIGGCILSWCFASSPIGYTHNDRKKTQLGRPGPFQIEGFLLSVNKLRNFGSITFTCTSQFPVEMVLLCSLHCPGTIIFAMKATVDAIIAERCRVGLLIGVGFKVSVEQLFVRLVLFRIHTYKTFSVV